MSKWICQICGYVYDEEKEGIPFSLFPDSWVCPLCGADKASFSPEGGVEEKPQAPMPVIHEDLEELSPGVLAAVCSNLARGCEKQYQAEEAALYQQLADFFTAAAPAAPQNTLEDLSSLVSQDLSQGYPTLHSAAKAETDRGTQRICVWGEKVTRIADSLLKRYQKEGEAFLQGTRIWVCSVCGFIYVGDSAPELCPGCKVPAWKFDVVEGRKGK